jgi:hypothetical protein
MLHKTILVPEASQKEDGVNPFENYAMQWFPSIWGEGGGGVYRSPGPGPFLNIDSKTKNIILPTPNLHNYE